MDDDILSQLDQFGTDYGNDPWSSDTVNQINTDYGGSGDYVAPGDSSEGNWWDAIGKGVNWLGDQTSGLFGALTGNTGGGYRFPVTQLAGSLLGMLGQTDVKKTLQDMFQQSLNADPWNKQMGQYQPLAYSAASQGLGNTSYGQSIMDATARKMASMGYMGSGNMAPAIATSLNAATPSYLQAIQPFAMGRAPNTTGAGLLGTAMGQAEAGRYNAMGYGLGNLLNGASTPAPVQRSSGGGSDFGLKDIAGLAGAAASIFSDKRLKSNIVKVGQDPRGFGIYEYDIFGRRERGVIAQEVQQVMPEAVGQRDGYLTVNYGMINNGR